MARRRKNKNNGCLVNLFAYMFSFVIVIGLILGVLSLIAVGIAWLLDFLFVKNLVITMIIIILAIVSALIYVFIRKHIERQQIVQNISNSNDVDNFDEENALDYADSLEGHDFEYWCADLLKATGFKDVSVTQGSGDDGVDIIASFGSKKYAIQCKRYSGKLGKRPIQEVYTGSPVYDCDAAAVMTNSYFTDGATALANTTGVELWDRDKLYTMLRYFRNTVLSTKFPYKGTISRITSNHPKENITNKEIELRETVDDE